MGWELRIRRGGGKIGQGDKDTGERWEKVRDKNGQW